MPDTSPRLQLPLLLPSQAQKHVTHNEALLHLDALTQASVIRFSENAPPPLPEVGDSYALGLAPEGVWAGHALAIAVWSGTNWRFQPPQSGWRIWGQEEQELRVWSNDSWVSIGPLPDGVESIEIGQLGVGTPVDPTNPLSVQGDSTLFTNDGAGHQVKINKAQQSDTAALLFQSNWVGHAEMGLSGSHNFSIKVSPDGNSWRKSMEIDATQDQISWTPATDITMRLSATVLTVDVPIEGNSVQADSLDADPLKLLKPGAFGLGRRPILVSSSDDLDTTENVVHFFGNASVGDVPTNSPSTGAAFVGLNLPVTTNRTIQLLGSCSADRLYFRRKNLDWFDWVEVCHSGNIVGVTSENAGLPTGSIIENGSNTNGTYTRWADGTQICTNDNAAIAIPAAAFVGTITKIDNDKLWIGRWF